MGDAGNFWKMKRGSTAEGCAAKGVGGWIGVKEMRLEARRGRGLPRIISFNYSKMSGWITSYFFLELTFNGLSALTATTDSFYILPLRERKREKERARVPNIVVVDIVVGLRPSDKNRSGAACSTGATIIYHRRNRARF